MNEAFDKRKKGFEAKFAVDEETKFKIQVRANKKLGLWVADRLGKSGDAAEDYAREVVKSDFEEAGLEDVFRKIMGDVGDSLTEEEVRDMAEKFFHEAAEELNPED